LKKALEHLKINWLDWENFKRQRSKFSWNKNERNGKDKFNFEDILTNVKYHENIKNMHKV
jgi:hypothetical protein